MANNSNKKLVPEAMTALDKFKYEVASEVGVNLKASSKAKKEAQSALDRFKMEVASEIGVNLKEGYNGDLTSAEAGSVGGNMVKKMIQQVENNMK